MRRNITRQLFLFATAVAIAVWASAQANADVITFDSLPVGQVAPNTMITEGLFGMFAFGGPTGSTMTIQNIAGTHQNVAVDGNLRDVNGTIFSIFLTGGGTFSLNSIDMGDLLAGGGRLGSNSCSGGFRIQLTDNLGQCFAVLPSTTFSTIPSPGFKNISALFITIVSDVNLDTFNFAIDNINLPPDLVPTPEPSSLLLVLAGVAAVSFFGRLRQGGTLPELP